MGVLGVFGIGLLGAFVLSIQMGIFGPIPSKRSLTSIRQPIASEVYSTDSVLLGRYYLQDRTPTPFEKISPWVIQALIHTEDARFYEHSGIDYRSMARVVVKSILLRKSHAGGGSTLSQQLAKNLYPRKSHGFLTTPVGKVKEMTIAMRLESLYSKENLLELYLNTVPFGDNVFGIAAASERFFNKPPLDLAPEEAALLVGMLKGTHAYNPRIYPERAHERRNIVLLQMQRAGAIDQTLAKTLMATEVTLHYTRRDHHEGSAPYFREYLRQQLLAWCRENKRPDGMPYNLYTDGLKIYTTLDSRLQKEVEAATKKHMRIVQKRFDAQWRTTKPWDAHPEILQSAIRKSAKYKVLKAQGMEESEILVELERPRPVRVYTPEGPVEREISTLDSIKHHLMIVQTGSLAMDPHTGAIRAWVGGLDSRWFQYDQASPRTRRQAGSTIKPLMYAAALEQGVPPCQYISAERVSFTDREDWTPNNTRDNYHLKYSMQGALMESVNTVSVRIMEETGIPAAVTFARRLGLGADLPEVPAIALGTPSVSLMEMVRAYSSFVNEGYLPAPWVISSITDAQGQVLLQTDIPQPTPVMQGGVARQITHMLQSVVEEGTAASLRSVYGLRSPLAGKTGTTQANADGWFVGMTPHLVMATRVGADDPRIHFKTTALGQGSQTALPIFAYTFQQVERDKHLNQYLGKQFAPLSPAEARNLQCEPFKEDITLMERIFGKKQQKEQKQRNFGEKDEKRGVKRWFERKRS
jgi:penicillin-binding protein 1A